jgi:pimeloyl-ACP methyl ester carboxylesterase
MNRCHIVALGTSAFLAGTVTDLAAQENTTGTTEERDLASIDLQEEFDHIGAEVHSLTQGDRTIYYIDEGQPGDRAVVFIGGQGTSLEVFQLTEFARSSREELGLRVISVERNGFGESEFDPSLGYADYVNEVLAVLDHLGVEKFAIMGISGGGAYAAHLAATVPDRVISLHLGAASSRTLPSRIVPSHQKSGTRRTPSGRRTRRAGGACRARRSWSSRAGRHVPMPTRRAPSMLAARWGTQPR